ncbi:MAG TPA: TraM recognition domain-containing protein, partial [Clostridium sp.]|uniref:TraM recognition domain-containing protein n=1 Tax=Clostridium sp. TaxID=1506 RepID=UPI002F93191E
YGFRNIISTQELADMTINNSSKLLDQIWGCTNVKIALRQDVFSSQQVLSNGIGTKDIYKPMFSSSKESGKQEQSSTNVSLEEEFVYKPREFGQLKVGEAIVFIKVPKFRYAKIKIRMVD